MTSSLPGSRELPTSQYDLSTYWGRVKQSAIISDPSTLFTSKAGLEHAKSLVSAYKQGHVKSMTPELWQAKKIVDSTLHPDTGEPVFLPFRMSCFVISNLVVTAGMLTPNLTTLGTLGWQITNQSLNVGINASNANKSTPLSNETLIKSYLLAVSASCSVALGLNAIVPRLKRVSPSTRVVLSRLVPFAAVASAGVLNVFLMRGEEIRQGIDVYPARRSIASTAPKSIPQQESSTSGISAAASIASTPSAASGMPITGDESTTPSPSSLIKKSSEPDELPTSEDAPQESLGKSRRAATIAVAETALSRVLNATPIMVLPPLILVRLQGTDWLKARPRMVLPINLGLILGTSIFALPMALGVFPQRQTIAVRRLEEEFWGKVGEDGEVEFNRGI